MERPHGHGSFLGEGVNVDPGWPHVQRALSAACYAVSWATSRRRSMHSSHDGRVSPGNRGHRSCAAVARQFRRHAFCYDEIPVANAARSVCCTFCVILFYGYPHPTVCKLMSLQAIGLCHRSGHLPVEIGRLCDPTNLAVFFSSVCFHARLSVFINF